MRKDKRSRWIFFTVLLMILIMGNHFNNAGGSQEKLPIVGPVKINLHPSSLENKTVVLRWNGKYNGDKFLIRLGELMAQQVKNVRIIKMWETDKITAAISKNAEVSEQVATSIAKLKPDLVIAAQAD